VREDLQILREGVHVIVGTPGRVYDMIQLNALRLNKLKLFVLDEADQMLDMGFVVPIRRIAKTLPRVRQNLFFSATMPSEIEKLAAELLNPNPSKVSVTPQATTVEKIDQKVLFIEEIQSDWHQAGREKGYFTENLAKLNEFNDYKKYLKNIYNRDPEYISVQERLTPEELAKFNELRSAAYKENKTGSVPDAPFKDTWYQLALKRAIQHAAENGYDRIGLTTGKQQAARFDLSKQVEQLNYKKNPDGTYQLSAQAEGRGNLIGESIPENKLSDYVGKDVAKKITDNAGDDVNFGGNGSVSQPKDIWKGLSGIDLQVGGEGMKKYYDEIYPKFLDKYGKKWGAKVGETSITTGRSNVGGVPSMYPDKEPIRYLDITPEMKAGVSKGQPLFAAVPAIPAAGLLAPQEKRR
jgi:hypothetical protein